MDDLNARVLARIDDLSQVMAAHPAVYGPVRFWDALSAKHKQLIERYGFDKFKRTVNFEYNQWGVTSLRDRKIRRLLRQLLSRRQLPHAAVTTRVDHASMADVRWPDHIDDRTGEARAADPGRSWRIQAYRIYVALLWQYAELEDRLGCLARCQEPPLGSPLPLRRGGRLISQDLATSSLELNFVATHVPMAEVRRIGEIGAGYGRFAHLVMQMFPAVDYHIFDIPPTLAVADAYLAETLGDGAVHAHLPHELEAMPDGHFDLMVNVSSFDEMAPEQVHRYLAQIDAKGSRWLYLKGYATSRSRGDRLGVEEFPIPPGWRLAAARPDPVVDAFVERIYSR